MLLKLAFFKKNIAEIKSFLRKEIIPKIEEIILMIVQTSMTTKVRNKTQTKSPTEANARLSFVRRFWQGFANSAGAANGFLSSLCERR